VLNITVAITAADITTEKILIKNFIRLDILKRTASETDWIAVLAA
jgi:hypothetical protein